MYFSFFFLVGILSILILAIKNREKGGGACFNKQNLLSADKSYLSTVPA